MTHQGNAWKFGDNIDTDQIAPNHAYRRSDPETAYVYCMENQDPDFHKKVQVGDIFVAGANLGIGSSREWAPFYLHKCGIRIALAKSFARIFYRNSFNLALPALVCADTDKIETGDVLDVDPLKGQVKNITKDETYACDPVPEHLMQMVADGGLLPHLKKKLAN
ncbi:MAG: 3-isopropylmalate dehydratase [Rhodospirillaceae bacterium]